MRPPPNNAPSAKMPTSTRPDIRRSHDSLRMTTSKVEHVGGADVVAGGPVEDVGRALGCGGGPPRRREPQREAGGHRDRERGDAATHDRAAQPPQLDGASRDV